MVTEEKGKARLPYMVPCPVKLKQIRLYMWEPYLTRGLLE